MKVRALVRALGVAFVATGFAVLFTTVGFTADGPFSAPAAPVPSATPKFSHGGPITLGVTGNLIAGQQITGDGQRATQSTTTSNAGALIDLGRRTGSTNAEITLPASLSGHGATIGQLGAEYDTGYASYIFGSQQVGAIGLLPAGSTTRGSSLLIPQRHGDFSVFAGLAGTQPSFLVRGVRMRLAGKRGYGAISAYDAVAKDGGHVDGVVIGLASRPGKLSGQFESGISIAHGVLGSDSTQPDRNGTGFGLYGRADAGGTGSYASVIVRDLTPAYLSLGGFSQSERYAGLTYRSTLGRTSYTVGLEADRTGSDESVDDVRRATFSATRPLGRGTTLQFNAVNQQSHAPGDRQWTGTLATAITFPFAGSTFGANLDVMRATDQLGSPSASVDYQLSASHGFPGFTLQGSAAVDRSAGEAGIDRASTFTIAASRTHGKTGVTVGTQFGTQQTLNSSLSIVAPTVTVTRRLSNALFATINAALQYRRDAIAPINDGHSLQFSFSLGAPFSFGNGVVSGRADPRLPGTINGIVQSDATSPGVFVQTSGFNTGAANVAVVLDNQEVVRTDLQGRFSFRFVRPGKHAVTIDPASLPRGTQPAAPITSLAVQGGQVAQIVLTIGSYGAVLGSIGVDEHGHRLPISGVSVVLDGALHTTSDAQGNFAFGGLPAGKHTVDIVPDTFPASFSTAAGQNTKNVQVVTGDVAHVQFSGAPLGSIAGRLTFGKDQPAPGKGVENAYVVANPGDHAVITDSDGTYLFDNLAAGKYTLSVDGETLADGLGVTSDRELPVELDAGAALTGANFTIGTAEKGIVFTYKGNETNVVTARALERAVPPGGFAIVVVTTTQQAKSVYAKVADETTLFTYRKARNDWVGTVRVPAAAQKSVKSIEIDAEGKTNGTASVDVTVDPALPIATYLLTPPNAVKGQYVHVRAHMYVDAKAGDKILWQDGAVTVLPAPKSGRFFEFDVRLGAVPYHGALATANGQLPVQLGR